ncbi:MAG TPA: hypothetical protein ACHBX0_09910 [Arsenophonus sp.]
MRSKGYVALLCIVRQVSHSLRYVEWKDHKTVASDLCSVYNAFRND